MNKLLLIYGCALFSGSPIVEQQESTVTVSKTNNKTETTRTLEHNVTALDISAEETSKTLVYTTDFSKAESSFDIKDIEFLEVEDQLELGFDTSEHLPEGFDPYSAIIAIKSINFMEEEALDLGFNTADYLPEGFNPYKVYFDIGSITFGEDELEYGLGFDTLKYLPTGFNAYTSEVAMHTVNFMEDEEIELGFDTSKYLPENFDPYTRSN